VETRNPSEWRRKLPVEAASGLNDWLGSEANQRSLFVFYWCFCAVKNNGTQFQNEPSSEKRFGSLLWPTTFIGAPAL
jgi:hypothetical protein